MPSDPRIRASDADRDRTAALLREHLAAGRLTAEEFNERLDAAYAAKTLGELDQLLADLPGIDLYELPDASLRRGRRPNPGLPWMLATAPSGELARMRRGAWALWLPASVIAFAVWLLTGHPGGLWFLWVVGPCCAMWLARWLAGGHSR